MELQVIAILASVASVSLNIVVLIRIGRLVRKANNPTISMHEILSCQKSVEEYRHTV